jgi:hypothetical protein
VLCHAGDSGEYAGAETAGGTARRPSGSDDGSSVMTESTSACSSSNSGSGSISGCVGDSGRVGWMGCCMCSCASSLDGDVKNCNDVGRRTLGARGGVISKMGI